MICDIFERHTLLNKLAARRRFYTASMVEGEKILTNAARIRKYSSTLKSMGVTVDDGDMAMTLLCGLPSRFDGLVCALDAVIDDSLKFNFQFECVRIQSVQ